MCVLPSKCESLSSWSGGIEIFNVTRLGIGLVRQVRLVILEARVTEMRLIIVMLELLVSFTIREFIYLSYHTFNHLPRD
jgi:hypothetical protein